MPAGAAAPRVLSCTYLMSLEGWGLARSHTLRHSFSRVLTLAHSYT